MRTITKQKGITVFNFVDSINGIQTLVPDTVRITTDGGRTWDIKSLFHDTTWQPLAIKGTSTYFIASMYGDNDKILRSDDYGYTWDTVYTFPTIPLTGVIYGDLCHLYVQSPIRAYLNNDSIRGVFESTDRGKSWHKIKDLIGNDWFRFYFRNNVLFIGENRIGSTPEYANSLWRYQLPPNKPTMIVDNVTLSAKECNTSDTLIAIAAVNQCDGEKVILDTLFTSGSSAFTVSHNGDGREIVWDTIRVQYTPIDSLTDIGQIHLRLRLKGNTFDTVITLTGQNITPHQDISFTPVLTASNLIAGKEAECNVYSSNRIQDRGLDKVTFDLTYDDDLLEAASITAQNGMSATYTSPIITNGVARLPITITGNNMTIDSLAPMVTVKFRTYLTDTTLSTIELSTITLNDDNPDYKNCTLSAIGNSTTFTQASVCGDSTIRAFIQTGKLIDIVSISPNPTNGNISVAFESFSNNNAQLQLLDELGKVVYDETLLTKRGVNEHSVVIPKHWSGTFYLRLQMGKEVVTGKFVKQ